MEKINYQEIIEDFLNNTSPHEALKLLSKIQFKRGEDVTVYQKLEKLLLQLENIRMSNNNARMAFASVSSPHSTAPSPPDEHN